MIFMETLTTKKIVFMFSSPRATELVTLKFLSWEQKKIQ